MLSINTNLTSTLMFTKHRLLYHIMLICNWLLSVIYYFIITDSLQSLYIPTSRTTALHIYIAGSSPSSRRSLSGSSPSSRNSTTSPATWETPRRALIAPCRALTDLSLSSRRSSPSSHCSSPSSCRALTARTVPPAMLGDWSGKHILSQTTEHVILLDHPISAPPRPPD
jgi:hypothetical protein